MIQSLEIFGTTYFMYNINWNNFKGEDCLPDGRL